jgi:hypothetical protein
MSTARVLLAQPANPGGSATATIYDRKIDAAGGNTPRRIRVVAYVDQDATFYVKWAARNSSNLRTYNGGGSGETITANVLFERDVLCLPGRLQVTIVTGTIPTVWEVDAEAVFDQSLAQ